MTSSSLSLCSVCTFGIGGRIAEAPTVLPVHAIAERRGHDVAVLFGELRQLPPVVVEERVLRAAQAVQRDDQRKRARRRVRRGHVHPVRHHFLRVVECVVALDVARAAGERIAVRFHRGEHRLGAGEILVDVQRAQLEAAAIDVAHAIDRIEDLGAQRFGCGLRLVLEPAGPFVDPFVQRDTERRVAERARGVGDLHDDEVPAVRHAAQIELEFLRRFAQIAADALDRLELFHDRERRGATGIGPSRHESRTRRERARELDGRRVELFEPHDVRLLRFDNDAIGAQQERVGEVRAVGPRSAGEKCVALGEQAPQLAGASQPIGVAQIPIERVELALELAGGIRGGSSARVSDVHGGDARERLRPRDGRCKRGEQGGPREYARQCRHGGDNTAAA